MNETEIRKNGTELTIAFRGSISSGNAGEVEKTVMKELSGVKKVVIDCSKLNYISSAGLRIILKIRKLVPDTEARDVSSDVYEIFDMTGFTEMIKVKKAMRRIGVEGCEVIGEGANGLVYRIDDETIVKVYKNPDALEEIDRERELARRAFILGIPTAIPYDVVLVDDYYGSVFELLSARSFASILKTNPERLDELVPLYVDVMKKLHAAEDDSDELPSIKERLLRGGGQIREALPEELCEKLLSMIKAVPDRRTLVHGDYHVKNVMLQDGEALLIDMDTLSTGHPVFELGLMYASYVAFTEPEPERNTAFFGVPYRLLTEFLKKSMRLYFEGRDEDEVKRITERVMIIGYYRALSHYLKYPNRDVEFRKRAIDNCVAKLKELLAKQDGLEF